MKTVWDYIQEMLEYKESLGFSRKTYEGILNNFGRFAENRSDFFFSQAAVNEWCIKRDTEQASGFRKRVTVLREFSKYLYAMKISSFIIPTDIFPVLHPYTPYIFSGQELDRLFRQADLVKHDPKAPAKKLIIPVIYRLIYLCGLRPNEGRELMLKDVDLKAGSIFIRNNKSRRERLIPMAGDVTEMCRNYQKELCLIYPDSEYLFPSPSGLPYSAKWLTRHFLQLWDATKAPGNTARVMVYGLRHRYATAVFMKWLDDGEDLYALLPYLSEYMGHSHIKGTAYYIHLLPEKLRKTASVDWKAFEKLLPEVEYE